MAAEPELSYPIDTGATPSGPNTQRRISIYARGLFSFRPFIEEPVRPNADLFRVFIETMNQGAVMLSAEGLVLYSNQVFSSMICRSQRELIGARFSEWVVDECQRNFAQLLSGSTAPFRSELQLLRADGVRVPVQLAINRLDGSDYPGSLGIIVLDRTEQLSRLALELENQAARELDEMSYERHEDLERVNLKLAKANRRMAALCAELCEKTRQLEQADAMKTRILSNISHELRSPLHSILAVTSLLAGHGEGGSNGEQQKLLGYIRNAADSLFNLVNDLLDLAKIASGKMEIHAVEFGVAELFATLRGMLPPPLLNPAVRLIFDAPAGVPPLYSDQGKIAQIVRNLIDNGLKFTEHGEVRVNAGYNQINDTVTFAVRDTGVGIAAPDHEKIFEEFIQLDSPARDKIIGTGLGLSICRNLATVLGGRISVESELGAGATFLLSVPRRALSETEHSTSDDDLNRAQANNLQVKGEVIKCGNS